MRKPQKSLLAVSVSVASLLLASTSFAGHAAHHYKENYKGEAMPCPVELMIKDGFYVGLQGGLDSYRVKNEVAVLDPNGPFTQTLDPVLSAVGPVGGLFVGWGMYFDQYYNAYLGLEVFGNWTGAKTDFEDATVSPLDQRMINTSVKAKSNYGIDVLPGVKVNNASLFYVRLGYNWARFNVSQTFTDGAVAAANVLIDTKKTRGGFHYGVGIETTFWDNWSVRGEYTHTGFSSISGEPSASTTVMTSEFMPSDNQFMLGLLYHFTI